MADFYICAVCNKKIDKRADEYVKYNARRYAHKDCVSEDGKAKSGVVTLAVLQDYINQLFQGHCDWPQIMQQIKKYTDPNGEYKFTYSGIQKTLHWFYVVMQSPIEQSNNALGIIPYVYSKALKYYKDIYDAQQANQDKVLTNKVKVVKILSPKADRHIKEFDFGEEEKGDN